MKPRARGVVGTIPVKEPTGYYADIAKTKQRQKHDELIRRRENFVMLNKHTYKELYERWKANGGGRLPVCKRCREYTIHWDEPAHVCEGYKPQFVEHTPERKERWEAEREEIRESRRQLKAVMCSVCGEILECPEDAEWHWEQHEGKPEREHYAIDGEPDGDLDGYEDEPEEDYCEGDDDGYDCD
jgi:hypothetical protein